MNRVKISFQEAFSRAKRFSIVAFLLFFNTSCQWIGEAYVGLHMQPDLDKNDFVPGLNVFGALKTGETFDTINHYFEVQQLLALVDTSSEMVIDSAVITLKRHMLSGEVKNYSLLNYGNGLYFKPDMEIEAGERWDYSCSYKSFVVTSTCTIPYEPVIKTGSLKVDNRSIHFEVLNDTTAFIYDVYLLSGDNLYYDRVVAQQYGNTFFAFQTEWELLSDQSKLYVFAYDRQFETYFSTSSIFFKPNAYRPPFTAVNGGYGVFGGISSKCVIVK